jgi:hypothetical protein
MSSSGTGYEESGKARKNVYALDIVLERRSSMGAKSPVYVAP